MPPRAQTPLTASHSCSASKAELRVPSIARVWLLSSLLVACGNDSADSASKFAFTRAELLDPQSCSACHSEQYRDWSGSMHAYASDDPLFLAMNQRGQREAQLADFCVKCHAPMATREGQTSDGLNLPSLPTPLKGVTCFFCH